jgi:hypothetical protein
MREYGVITQHVLRLLKPGVLVLKYAAHVTPVYEQP